MQRSEKNHWWMFAGLALLGNGVLPVLFLKTDPAYLWTGTILVAIALIYAAYRLTCTKRWWVGAIIGSPLFVWPLLIGIACILAVMGILPVP